MTTYTLILTKSTCKLPSVAGYHNPSPAAPFCAKVLHSINDQYFYVFGERITKAITLTYNKELWPIYFLLSYYYSSSNSTSIRSKCQISSTYCWIVRSEVNFPERATFKIAFLAQTASSRYVSCTLFCAST